jgi:tetratricopeptide (TPR) repeat protein
MAKKKKQVEAKGFDNVEQTLSRTEQFIEDNYKQLLYGLAVIVVLVAAFWLIKIRLNSRTEDALAQMYVAEDYFAKDSLNLALNGDGNYLGFVDIADEYKATRPGNLANYYAGLCYLQLGQFEDAIEYFDRFDKNDEAIAPLAYACTGDAYIELGDSKRGIEFYLKAVNYADNDFYNPLYLLKAGQVYELDGNNEKALEMYQRIKNEYPESNEGSNIDKYIARVSK